MMEKLEKFKSAITWPIAAVLIAGAAGFVAIALLAPPETQTLLFGANGLIWTLVGWWLRSPRDAGPLVALLGVLAIGGALTGCGVSAVRASSTTITLAAQTTGAAAEVIHAAALADAQRTCPDTPNDDADRACVAQLRVRWAPADAAIASIEAALVTAIEAVDLARASGNGAALEHAIEALARVVVKYGELQDALADADIDIPPLPDAVLELARGLVPEVV